MGINEKVDYYYNQIATSCLGVNDKLDLIINSGKIKNKIKEIVQQNKDYLLTPAFILYLRLENKNASISNKLAGLTRDKGLMLTIKDYLESLDGGAHKDIYYSILTNYETAFLNHYSEKLEWFYDYDYPQALDDLIDAIAAIIGAHVLIKRETIEEFDTHMKDYLENPLGKIDELMLQGVVGANIDDDGDVDEYYWHIDHLLEYISTNLHNKKKVIR